MSTERTYGGTNLSRENQFFSIDSFTGVREKKFMPLEKGLVKAVIFLLDCSAQFFQGPNVSDFGN